MHLNGRDLGYGFGAKQTLINAAGSTNDVLFAKARISHRHAGSVAMIAFVISQLSRILLATISASGSEKRLVSSGNIKT